MVKRLPRPLLYALVAVAPSLITVLLIAVFYHASVFDFRPAAWNDEFHHYRAAASFSAVGFSGGYSVVDETPARARFSHYGSHGPMFPVIYGSIGRIVGWHLYSTPLFNLILVPAALFLFFSLVRLDRVRTLIAGAFLVTCWSFMSLINTGLTDGLNFVIAILAAALFHLLIFRNGAASRRFVLGLVLFICAISVVRISWCMLLVPALVIPAARKSVLWVAGALPASVLLMGALFWVTNYLAPPLEFGFVYRKLASGEISIWDHVDFMKTNVLEFINSKEGIPVRVQEFQIVLVFLGAAVLYLRRRKWWVDPEAWGALLIAYAVSSIVAATVMFYLIRGGGFRLFGIYLMFAVLLLLASKSRHAAWLAGAVIVCNAAILPIGLEQYREWRRPNYSVVDTRAFEDATRDIQYDPKAGPWCNTVSMTQYTYEITALPPEIGVSWIYNPASLKAPMKSKYLILWDDQLPQFQSLHLVDDVKLLAQTPLGGLYLNRASGCAG